MAETTRRTAAKKTAAKKTASSKSGNPAVRAAAKAASDVSAFKKRAQGATLELPSGLVVMAKRVDMQTLLVQGNVPNPLMEVVEASLKRGQKADIAQMVGVEEGELDLDTIREMYDMANLVVIRSVISPPIHPVPNEDDVAEYNAKLVEPKEDDIIEDPEELRDDSLLYIDEIDEEDKMFIFQWAQGGVSDVATFREEARADMAALAEIQGAKSAAK